MMLTEDYATLCWHELTDLAASMHLAALDFAALLGYLVLLGLVAWRMGRASSEANDYFLAGGRIPWWAAACSFVATAMTAASVFGLPQAGYASNFVDIGANIAALVAVVFIIGGIVPRVLSAGQVTVYRMLDQRFFDPGPTMVSVVFYGRPSFGERRSALHLPVWP